MLAVYPVADSGLTYHQDAGGLCLPAEVFNQFLDHGSCIHATDYRESYYAVNRYSYLPSGFAVNTVDGMKTTLQDRLRSALAESPLTQTELAKLSGISQPTLSALIRVDGTGSQNIAQIAHNLGVRALWLATGEGPRYESDFFLDGAESELISIWRKFPPASQRSMLAQFRAVLNSLEDPAQS